VRTDHYNLKYLLDQRLSTVPQHQWVSKLFGFDFAVEFRPGRLSTVADALSCRDIDATDSPAAASAAVAAALSGPSFSYLDDVRRATATAPDALALLERLRAGDLPGRWHEDVGLLLHGSRIFVPDVSELRP
jgi:hypothetical protein